VLSPSNKKRGSLRWTKYLRKRKALLWARPAWWGSTCCAAASGGPMLDPWPESP
jgi:hypothetical protein